MTRWIVFIAALCGLPLNVRAQTTETTELAVNGPERAILSLDGQRVGTLPLASSLRVPAGAHRFRLELGTAAVVTSGLCQVGPGSQDSCSQSYDKKRDGVGLLSSGIVLAAAGTIVLSIPPAKRSR